MKIPRLPDIDQLVAAVADRVAAIVADRIARDVEARIMTRLEPRLQLLSTRILTQSGVVAEIHAHELREQILSGSGPTPEQIRAKRNAALWGHKT